MAIFYRNLSMIEWLWFVLVYNFIQYIHFSHGRQYLGWKLHVSRHKPSHPPGDRNCTNWDHRHSGSCEGGKPDHSNGWNFLLLHQGHLAGIPWDPIHGISGWFRTGDARISDLLKWIGKTDMPSFLRQIVR